MPPQPENILVTGGAGFIGANFVKNILRKHPETNVVNLDALTYAGNLANLESEMDNPKHAFVHGDIRDPILVRETIEKHGVDTIVNFAAESHVDRSIEGPKIFVETNVLGTLNLLEIARTAGVKRFLQVSTDEVYGSLGENGSFTEQTNIKPNSPYSASKAAADHLVHSFHHTFGMDCVITRCSNNYGPFQFPEKMIPLCVNNARLGKKIPVYGDGLQVRDWLFVEDHCDAIWAAVTKAEPGEVFNIGGNSEKRNIDLVKTILNLAGRDESLIEFVKDRPGHDRRYAIDASKIKNTLRWTPSLSFEEGMAKTFEWYMDNLEWVESVTSGEYKNYYDKMYADR
jgi:dTDP-glucose 4,6-dehydratase